MIPAAIAMTAALLLAARTSPAQADSITNGISTSSSDNPVSIEKYGRTWYEYYVTTSTGIPTASASATAPQVIASLPSGVAIDPPDSTLYPNNTSPQAYSLTYTDSSGNSHTTVSNESGFTQSQMVLGLNTNATTGQQLFGLSFYGSGVAATNTSSPSSGGLADIWLSFANSQTTQPLFQSVSPNGVSIIPVPKTTTTSTPTTTTATTTTTSTSTTTSTPAVSTPVTSQIPEPMSIVLWTVVIGGLRIARARSVRARHQAV